MKNQEPTIYELEINEKLLGQCNHLHHTTETSREYGYESHDLICTNCGEKFHDYSSNFVFRNEVERPEDYCKKFIPKHCSDVVMARKLLRQLEKRGWNYFFTNKNNLYVCNLIKGKNKFTSKEASTEQEAICNAAYKATKIMS